MAERDRLIEIVLRLLNGTCASDAEVDQLVAEFERGVPDPRAVDLVFWPHQHFDREPTAAEIVDRALSYRPTEL